MTIAQDTEQRLNLLRYPGGKQRQLPCFFDCLPSRHKIGRRYVEPFLGGAAVFFAINPSNAILSDINQELIDLYIGIKTAPHIVWQSYRDHPSTKEGYYHVRSMDAENMSIPVRAARTLFLNRTCFKGMWRHNANGDFNVGYGGQDRRWVIQESDLVAVAQRLAHAEILCCDFAETINSAQLGDFLFLDPPYTPGENQLTNQHYQSGNFRFEDQERLAVALRRAAERNVMWAMTNSSHPDILDLYSDFRIIPLPKGTGQSIGHMSSSPGEVLICNYAEKSE